MSDAGTEAAAAARAAAMRALTAAGADVSAVLRVLAAHVKDAYVLHRALVTFEEAVRRTRADRCPARSFAALPFATVTAAVDAGLDALRAHAADAELLFSVLMRLLTVLAAPQQEERVFAHAFDRGLAEALVCVMQAHAAAPKLQHAAGMVLVFTTRDAALRDRAVRAGALAAAVAAAATHGVNRGSQPLPLSGELAVPEPVGALRAVRVLLRNADAGLRREARALGAAPALIAALRSTAPRPQVDTVADVLAALATLFSPEDGDDANAAEAADALDAAFASGAAAYPDVPHVTGNACVALSSLWATAARAPGMQRRRADAATAVDAIMQRHAGYLPHMAAVCCAALRTLATRVDATPAAAGAPRAAALDPSFDASASLITVIRALRTHKVDTEVQLEGMRALQVLMGERSDGLHRSMDAVVTLMEQDVAGTVDERAARNACSRPGCGARSGAGGAKLRACAACAGLVRYCSKECQREHWPRHKAVCRARAAMDAYQAGLDAGGSAA
jgi:hypothetical protein